MTSPRGSLLRSLTNISKEVVKDVSNVIRVIDRPIVNLTKPFTAFKLADYRKTLVMPLVTRVDSCDLVLFQLS